MALVLIGYRGTGKTTVARELARRLGWDWVDADVEVELRAGKSIAAIFADDGEPRFRDLEAAVIAELAQRPRTVVAAGGGVVLRPENRAVLAEAREGVVWLRASVATLVARIAADATTAARRPALTAAGSVAEVGPLLAEREPLYQAVATVAIETDDRSPQAIVEDLLAQPALSLRPLLN